MYMMDYGYLDMSDFNSIEKYNTYYRIIIGYLRDR